MKVGTTWTCVRGDSACAGGLNATHASLTLCLTISSITCRFLELDVREAHVEEKVNALETMKVLLTAGSDQEQRLRGSIEHLKQQHALELMLAKEAADTVEADLSDKLVRAEIEIARLVRDVRVLQAGADRQENLQRSALEAIDRVAQREDTLRLEHGRMLEDKQRAMKLYQAEYGRHVNAIEKERAVLDALIAEQQGSCLRTRQRDSAATPSNKQVSADEAAMMARVLNYKAEAEEARLGAKLSEETVAEQAKVMRVRQGV